MSTTSTTLPKKNRTKRSFEGRGISSNEKFRITEKLKYEMSNKWSDERVLHELSSFITEFSYLTEGRNSKDNTPEKQIRSYTAHLVRSSENDHGYFNKNNTNRIYKKDFDRYKKSVEWIDQHVQYPYQKKNSFFKETLAETSEEEVTKKQQHHLRHDFDYTNRRVPYEKVNVKRLGDRNGYRKPRSSFQRCKNCNSPQYNNLKTHNERKVMKFRSEPKERNIRHPYQRSRVNISKSRVRYWPFRYKQMKARFRADKSPNVPKKENYVPVETKVEDLSEPATIITLYPRNSRKYYIEKPRTLDFLTDPKLPCKCFKCMKKFERLQKIAVKEPKVIYFEPKINKSIQVGTGQQRTLCNQPNQCDCRENAGNIDCYTVEHPGDCSQFNKNNTFKRSTLDQQRVVKCLPPQVNSCCYNNTNKKNPVLCLNCFWKFPTKPVGCAPCPTFRPVLAKGAVAGCCKVDQFFDPYSSLKCQKVMPCHYPCGDNSITPNLINQRYGKCKDLHREASYRSVYFRVDCVGRKINPDVTQYFESILSNKSH